MQIFAKVLRELAKIYIKVHTLAGVLGAAASLKMTKFTRAENIFLLENQTKIEIHYTICKQNLGKFWLENAIFGQIFGILMKSSLKISPYFALLQGLRLCKISRLLSKWNSSSFSSNYFRKPSRWSLPEEGNLVTKLPHFFQPCWDAHRKRGWKFKKWKERVWETKRAN